MKLEHILFAALTVALAASCATDDSANGTDNGQNKGKTRVTLTASTPETRVGMTKESNTTASLYWQSDDAILVQTVKDGTYGGAKLAAADGTETGSKSATFTGEVETGTSLGTYAVYPYNEKHSFTGEKALTYNLPATYEYKTVGSQIFSKTVDGTTTYPSNSTNMPMLGTISDSKATFKMLGGMAVIRIDNMPAVSGTLKVTADQQLSGNFTVADVSVENASIATSTSSTDNSVTFNFAGATAESAGVFYLPLATGDYTNLTIAVTCDGTTQTVNYGDLTIARAGVKAISLTTNSEGNLMYIESLGNNKYKINGHVFVDLGLSSNLLWAETNVGATLPADYGNYYAWGETATKTDYSWSTYKWTNDDGQSCTKYTSEGEKLEASDDPATAVWGTALRTPTKEEQQELIANCAYESANQTNSNSVSVSGYKFTGKTTGYTDNSVFLPSAGLLSGTTSGMSGNAVYWSSTVWGQSAATAWMLIFNTKMQNVLYTTRCYGLPVRPVTKLPSSMK